MKADAGTAQPGAEAEWLRALRDDLRAITEPAAKALWPSPLETLPPFFNYRMEHTRQVERDALLLLAEVGGDRETILAAVWIHDRFQPAFSGDRHGEAAAEWAAERLAPMGFPTSKVKDVCFAVANHASRPGVLPASAHEARLLWDADKAAHTGPFEVLMWTLNTLAADSLRSMQQNQAFPERALTLRDLAEVALRRFRARELAMGVFYFGATRKLATERIEGERHFVEALCRQVAVDPQGS
jgi:hypothetical protein